VSVDGDVAQTLIFPGKFLKNLHAHQVGHDVAESVVVVAFDPDDFNVAFGIGEFADHSEKLPVFFFEASKVEVGKDVAEQNEPAERSLLQHAGRIAGTTHLGAEMHVREDQRVIHWLLHALILVQSCYMEMKGRLIVGEQDDRDPLSVLICQPSPVALGDRETHVGTAFGCP
jgi:hypothetical protein